MDRTQPGEAQAELEAGMGLAKCRQCGCMQDTLDTLRALADDPAFSAIEGVTGQVDGWLGLMNPVKYDCLGCEHCYPALAGNAFSAAWPAWDEVSSLACSFTVRAGMWPPAPGEYTVLGSGAGRPVAVTTLGSVALAAALASADPAGLCIVGKTETENIGIDKIVKNTITNPDIRYLIVAGEDPGGHYPGATLLALQQHGIDDGGRVKEAPGKRPILRNVTADEIEAFRAQVEVIDMIGCADVSDIEARIGELAGSVEPGCGCSACGSAVEIDSGEVVAHIEAHPPEQVELDRAGYFVILPDGARQRIIVEHYDYDNVLLRRIEGEDARSLYWTIIQNGWVSQLSHAAYLGKELTRAEQALAGDGVYVQDGA